MGTLLVLDALRTWVVPAVTGGGIVVAAGLSAAEIVAPAVALTAAICCALILLLYLALRPLLAAGADRRAIGTGLGLAVLWFATCLFPFATRLFPGAPLLEAVDIAPGSPKLPLTIPAAGHRTLDVLVEGKLGHAATGAAIPVQYTVSIEDTAKSPLGLAGRFEEAVKTQRLGRRGSTVVHQEHSTERHTLTNPARGDLTITGVALEPADSPPLTLVVHAHPLPGPLVLVPTVLLLLAAVVAFDRTAAMDASDGALTLATTSVVGAAVVFWTSNAVHPSFSTLIGSAIFGGPIGFGAGALLWWIAKRVIARPTSR
ncbi:MAG: hypothetical protein U0807_00415 [Candidatus Binatia bacterium]